MHVFAGRDSTQREVEVLAATRERRVSGCGAVDSLLSRTHSMPLVAAMTKYRCTALFYSSRTIWLAQGPRVVPGERGIC